MGLCFSHSTIYQQIVTDDPLCLRFPLQVYKDLGEPQGIVYLVALTCILPSLPTQCALNLAQQFCRLCSFLFPNTFMCLRLECENATFVQSEKFHTSPP